MHYLIARDGQQLGQFSEEELRSGLFEGRYKPTDVIWTEGMPEWKPLGEIMGQGVTRIAGPQQPSGTSSSGSMGLGGVPSQSAGLAIAALVVGILALLTCGGFGLTAIPAIICGHMALSNINKSGGALGGRGQATAGLVMGYVSLPLSVALGVFLLLASTSVGAIGKMAEKGQIIDGVNTARNLVLACKIYASDHEGKFPATLGDLVTESALEDQSLLLKADAFKPAGWLGEYGFDYHGAGMKDDGPGSTPVITSRCYSKDGKRIVATLDGAVEVVKKPQP